MKIGQVGAELFHASRRADGRTDMTKLIVAFPNFANAPTNATLITVHMADVYYRAVGLNINDDYRLFQTLQNKLRTGPWRHYTQSISSRM